MTELTLTPAAARALHLAAQGLLQPRRKKAQKADVLDMVRHMGVLQIDTIHVLARSPYLVELKSVALEPSVNPSERLVRDVAGAVQRLANWHGCPHVRMVASEPAGFAVVLQGALDGASAEAP